MSNKAATRGANKNKGGLVGDAWKRVKALAIKKRYRHITTEPFIHKQTDEETGVVTESIRWTKPKQYRPGRTLASMLKEKSHEQI